MKKKLSLNKETVRNLNPEELGMVAGGDGDPHPDTETCLVGCGDGETTIFACPGETSAYGGGCPLTMQFECSGGTGGFYTVTCGSWGCDDTLAY